MALSGGTLAFAGLWLAAVPVFGTWLRLRFCQYMLTRSSVWITSPWRGVRSWPLLPGQRIVADDSRPGSVWFRFNLPPRAAPNRPSRRILSAFGVSPPDRIGFEQIPDAALVASLMREAIVALPET
ncbi:hypothetical protein [Gemmobacter sp. 24YEA27]|uniref:hypothetical protein n=1 Tax=Gemmobacter sp. 24YEA27 TaxID=3040672 RepID=UPI0024B34C38|nr:hypothetical protein [Gemmobacter sp. 24YEA27]